MSRLEAFVQAARKRVDDGFYATQGAPLASNGSLLHALQGGVIAELKARSPSEGALLRHPRAHMLAQYAAGGAAALSVLTDGDHFDGRIEDVRAANATGLPVLWKDFVIDEAQIEAAAHHGASAVLLIERILSPAQREALVQAAHDRGLEVLLEVHAAHDWETAQESEADLYGVNARDLETLQVDVEGSLALVSQIAEHRPVAALSGVRTRQDRKRALEAGACGVLVGTQLMRQAEPALMLKALHRPLVKVCGLTDVAGIEAAHGADLMGFVMTDSPRQVDADRVAGLMALAREHGALPVAVTKTLDAPFLQEAKRCGAAFAQGHRPDGLLSDIPILATIHPGESPPTCDAFLIDTPSTQGGGSGRAHDWGQSAQSVASAPQLLSFIAGGLGGDNVAQALHASGASGADASSRLESSPGRKDAGSVKAFLAHARDADE